jgi:hypothetical protein
MTPDAWDECGGCGHDRDDHRGGCAWPGCDCPLFTDEATR